MAFDGAGNYLRIHNWQQDAANGIDISAPEMDGEDNSIAGALSICVTRDGQGKMTADFLPNVDNTLNLGSNIKRWASINGVPIPPATSPWNFYPQTAAEAAVGVTPTQFFYAPFNVLRYGVNTTPGTSDMTLAFNNADKVATQAGGTLYVPAGVYGVSLTGITRNGCSWAGDGQYVSIVKSLAVAYVTTVTGMITITSKNNWTVEDLGFDVSAATFAAGVGNPGNIFWIFAAVTCNNWIVQNCAFTGIQAHVIGLAVNGGSNFTIEQNYFNMPAPSGSYNQSINISTAAGAVNAHYVRRNIMIGTGLFSNGAYGLIEGNVASGTGFGAALACGPLAACIGNRFIGNICFSTVGTDINGFNPDGIQCWSINGVVVGNYCYKNSGNGILVGGPNSTVAGNVCYDNSQVSTVSCGITLISSAVSSASNCAVTGNRCFDDQGSPTQVYGIAESVNGLAITGNVITGNSSTGNKTANYIYSGTPVPGLQYTAGQMQIDAASTVPAGGSQSVGLLMTGVFAQGIFIGSGVPTLTAAPGSLYIRTDGSSTSTRLYVGTAGFTWTNVVTAT